MAIEPSLREELAYGVLAARTVARLARVEEVVLAGLGLSLPQYRLLAYLSSGGAPAASHVADAMTVTRPSVTALVDGAVARGLVDRQHDTDDRRRVTVSITGEGERLLTAAERALTARLQELASHLGPEDAARAHEGLALWWQAKDVEVAQRQASDRTVHDEEATAHAE